MTKRRAWSRAPNRNPASPAKRRKLFIPIAVILQVTKGLRFPPCAKSEEGRHRPPVVDGRFFDVRRLHLDVTSPIRYYFDGTD
jgi:hypothetical protein